VFSFFSFTFSHFFQCVLKKTLNWNLINKKAHNLNLFLFFFSCD
jgi:hypothetical protein